MSAFYPSTSTGGQLSLLQDMATDHCGTHHTASVFGGGLRAPPSETEPAVEHHAGSLMGSRTGFPPNFLSYAGADFRNFRPPTAVDASAAAKVSPTGTALTPRRCRGDECNDDYVGGLDLTGIEMRDVFKPTPAVTVDHRPLGSPTSSSNHRHPDQPPHLQHHQLRSELLQQQQRHEELLMHQARQWYLNHSPTTSATSASAVDSAGVSDLVNGRSPGATPAPVFRHEATGPLVDMASGGGQQCHWLPPPVYSGSAAPAIQCQPSDPHHEKELSPTQKTGGGCVPFYPWMAVVGRYSRARFTKYLKIILRLSRTMTKLILQSYDCML